MNNWTVVSGWVGVAVCGGYVSAVYFSLVGGGKAHS